MKMIEVSNLSYYYTKERMILNGINLVLENGKLYVIFGPSGCGKTTLLSLLGGLDEAKEGTIVIDGREVREIGLDKLRKEKVSFIFQNYNLIDYMTPIENVQLTARVDPLPVLESMGLTAEEAKRNVLRLSGGQQQRVAIARALASQNPIILADEPTGNLDEGTAKEIMGILKDAARIHNRCVVLVSHSREAAEIADKVFELKGGKLEERDPQSYAPPSISG
ncbi:MAG: ATP-binding cassette domain-containing protein [Lachnospiraceae bacterium]|nr:ATP-binding cassette domain-containing protein [Lachnospiraceae bacterium]